LVTVKASDCPADHLTVTPVPITATSQRARQARTTASAQRHGQPWTEAEDTELAGCVTDDDLEGFALRHGRRFLSVEQRHRRPRPAPRVAPTGTEWVR
jgi:hypothetical protein